MLIITKKDIEKNCKWNLLIDEIGQAFKSNLKFPQRPHHTIAQNKTRDSSLLIMPGWKEGAYIGIKIVNVFPDNSKKNLPSVIASYILHDFNTGTILANIEGSELTAKRTMAASALASKFLSRENSTSLLIVGTGRLAMEAAFAHSAVRDIKKVVVWGRDISKAKKVSDFYSRDGLNCLFTEDLKSAVVDSDIISCVTTSIDPLILSDWVSEGTHVDLVGAFTPTMRESDSELIARSRVFVDTNEGALSEAGDLLIPIKEGVFTKDSVIANLYELTQGKKQGRISSEEITVFKSVGASIEDYAAAKFFYEIISKAN